ncbi:hypothetical protein AcW1_005178 [Taiwanofungus camphoratus]|nr:hypothetical protein AcW1_005178 [Antrodia cinnamomea]
MSERNKPCRLFASAGTCRFGERCKYSHAQPHGARSPSPSTTRTRTSTAAPRAASGAPPKVCNFYWTSGSCNRGFECSFRHERQPAAVAQQEPTETEQTPAAPDFFSAEGLAVHNGSVREEGHTLTPSEAHNHIQKFVHDRYVFSAASHVQGFVRILASVHDRNKAWNSDNAQAFLDMIVNGNALLRIGDVLRFSPVSFQIGQGSSTLSFQKGYFPVFEYFASNLVLKSTLHKNINHLYTVLENNCETIAAVIQSCVGGMVNARSWRDPTPNLPAMLQNSLDGVVVFKTLSTVLLQYLTRFKDAVRNHPEIAQLACDVGTWLEVWADGVSADPPTFHDTIHLSPSNVRNLTITQLREEVGRLQAIVQREAGAAERLRRPPARPVLSPAQRRQALISQLSQTYDPPGELRPGGPRHDNDKAEIAAVRVAPTHAELLAPAPPYLPVVVSDAPHHHARHSMERHLDIQFRLLREELIGSIRSSVSAVHEDLVSMWKDTGRKRDATTLEQVLAKKGGAYRTSGYDSVFFQIYTNVEFTPVKAERRDLTVGLLMDAPDHRAARDKDAKKRYDYWEHSKRLQGGSLVALVLVTPGAFKVFLGVISSFSKDIAESSKANAKQIQVRVSFFDAEVEFMALRRERISAGAGTFAFLMDNSVMFEAARPFLEHLQSVEPTEIPFARYIAHNGSLENVPIHPPRYATAPGFMFNLECLAKPGRRRHIQALNIMRPNSVGVARRQLLEHSTLDPSQVDAVVDTLTREVSLIQGPPGTGKSFTAKEILRVLFASGIKPIVLIAFTNHALDHMLTSVLDADITQKFVRLGARSSDERIAQYTLDKLEKVAGGSMMLDRPIKRQYAIMKKLEEDMGKVMESIQLPTLSWETIAKYLDIHHPDHSEHFVMPPYWIRELSRHIWEEEEANGEWATINKRQKKTDDKMQRTFYGFWKEGRDIDFISPPAPQPNRKKGKSKPAEGPTETMIDPVVVNFFTALGFESQVPSVPTTKRPTDELLEDSHVWSMSLDERSRLAAEWEDSIRSLAYKSHLQHYEELRTSYKEACKEYNDIRDETRRRLLSQKDLIGCTTTGAAKLTSLLSNISPKVLMVEEAGQVLEAHILTSLVSSVHHLICIGDPQQLRPTLATFALSMDSERGRELFKFDRSLMERLADSGLPMSQINVQRRMRPTISHFIRTILYPKLEDNEVVHAYPRVQGMQKDVYFMSHTNKENGSDDSVSKYNEFEVAMIRDLVLYFLRQGAYSGAGDIAVLCAYLGQLQKVRAALKDLRIAVAVDERDEDQLARQGIADETEFEEVVVARHIRLGTVDIFQGQEAKIVIVSLVRNSGTFETGSASIGFLKSSNRINVALSRAKHGLYILGNAANLRKNETWSTIINEMEARDQIGQGLPIVCPRHPDQKQIITKPGELTHLAPGGGCLLPCGFRLECGHICPSACHVALDNHRTIKCSMPCNETPCPRAHPCSRRCSDDCGKCEFPIPRIRLPCGHFKDKVACHLLDKLETIKCQERVIKQLPRCEHQAILPCCQSPASFQCKEPCGGALSCCSKTCKSRCSDCQKASGGMSSIISLVQRTAHITHPCDRSLYCEHPCGLDCSQDHHCNDNCKQKCRQLCSHHECPKPCSEPCAPCMEPCTWICAHQSCPVVCGSICSRLPCDEPCSNLLPCGHPCSSVCGEPCSKQACILCLPFERKADVVDLIMQRRLDEVDLTSSDTSERLITLNCGHIFTVETLDGHCGMGDYYEMDMMGRFVAIKAPPINYQKPPTCPTCRGPITSLRYGRVTKRATLDILEQNVASNMSRALDKLSPAVEALATNMDALMEKARQLQNDVEAVSDVSVTRSAQGKASEPLPDSELGVGAMQSTHGFSRDEAKAWVAVVKDLLKAYRSAVAIANTRGAHVKAYEAALTTLYRLEMEAIVRDPLRASEIPEPQAFAVVNEKIGQPPHKADTRFQIEAAFLALELRWMLAQIARHRVDGLPLTPSEEAAMKHRRLWTSFVDFIYESCVADAHKILVLAERSSASRQAVRSIVHILRAEFEQLRNHLINERTELFRNGRLTDVERRRLAERVKAWSSDMINIVERNEREYIRSRPSQSLGDLIMERTWYNDNCRKKVLRWKRDCDELATFMLVDKVYQPLSLQERQDIVKAFGFSHRGHFYNCENGHTFVITECGGAMESARCPECSAPVGGGGHRLHSSNTRAREFEAIASAQGSLPGVFDWTRDA